MPSIASARKPACRAGGTPWTANAKRKRAGTTGVHAQLNPPQPAMHPTHRTIGLGLLVLVGLVLLYYVWDYLIGFLAVIGAAQVYRVWRIHYRN